jgi:uncharacterized protein (TIGR00725 family)
MRKFQVVVIGDAIADKAEYEFGERLGHYLGKKGYTTITGGRSGIMEAVSKGAFEAGGITVGIIPGADFSQANSWCSVVIPTDLGHSRNSITALSADVIISIGGKAGTLTELGFGWILNKPIISVSQYGGWSADLSGKKIDDRRPDNIIAVDSFDALKVELEKIANVSKLN